MAAQYASEDRDLPAGDFSSWVVEMQGAIRGEHGSEVPCDGCTACCTSSKFIHIEPDETDTLSRIPAELLFPAPRLPVGHVVLGYDERGHCPMLVEEKCSIYAHRPKACRTYDCRIFAAAGLGVDGDEQASIARRVERWQFRFPTPRDRTRHDAVRAAAAYLVEHGDGAKPGVATNATRVAVLAIELHDVFLQCDEDSGEPSVIDPEPGAVRLELTRRTRSEMP